MLEFSEFKEMPKALASIQNEIKNPKKDSKGMHNSKYAQLDQVIDISKKILADAGFTVLQYPYNDGEIMGVETMLMHSSGEFIKGRFGSKFNNTDPQKAGSLITYYRRYGLSAMLNIASEDDDDADALASNAKPSEKQLNFLYIKVKNAGLDVNQYNAKIRNNINLKQFNYLKETLEKNDIDAYNNAVSKLQGSK